MAEKNSPCFPPWWNLSTENMGLEDLEQFKNSLESLKLNLIATLQEKTPQNLHSDPPMPYNMVPPPQPPNVSTMTPLFEENQVENYGISGFVSSETFPISGFPYL